MPIPKILYVCVFAHKIAEVESCSTAAILGKQFLQNEKCCWILFSISCPALYSSPVLTKTVVINFFNG